ncbi:MULTISPECIES: septal ring lytic transglycosylase RlpA family protein [unclassified Photobacterium]|uniref:septal ring lytic transglycosylase RlpA family protein n=1 Tax=unclassified Photobacterium TaxID=2628852 RepID=UPI001EE0A0E1|nr:MULTISPECIES: septal ring lytic transglycosylase RlpA family protein [unclassified Photobacterium]MCG3862696.1 septal ring lytic transglycosylase RlpA family protein [Photobacterium sp. Ph6]MCG3874227.1 septal ring lytic transglycosylase RlpA family protein [Photobacterium sp. Ph5]
MFLPKMATRQYILLLACLLTAGGCVNSGNEELTKTRPVFSHQHHGEYGKASYYANKYQGRKTASGQRFDQNKPTAAHRTLPFGTQVKVTNLANSKSVVVTVNDRGPFTKGRVIDLSRSAFSAIGNTASGVLKVKVETLN